MEYEADVICNCNAEEDKIVDIPAAVTFAINAESEAVERDGVCDMVTEISLQMFRDRVRQYVKRVLIIPVQ
jgi:hypothetical protein